MTLLKSKALVLAALLVAGAAFATSAQPAASYKNGTEFYLAYRAAFTKAKTIDDILPWMTKARVDEMKKTPAAQRAQMFGMIKEMDDHTNIKVLKETPKGAGAELQVEASSASSKSKSTATVTLVKEAGAWKLDSESWKDSMMNR
jgi:hypothetical protein